MSNSSGQQQSQTQAKLVLLGDMGAGKSSLVLRFVKGQFFEHQESTIGAAFMTQTVTVDDHVVKFEIWDTAGQERYHSLAPMYIVAQLWRLLCTIRIATTGNGQRVSERTARRNANYRSSREKPIVKT